ncbi:MAG: hypothetical protein GXN99_02315 [Candidatus Nanohaloarchaeota archaeon]|nr:hypothetical protein [Candidatus Nanohaloarchaeota archaeon]
MSESIISLTQGESALDEFMELLSTREKISIKEAAKILSLPEEIVEKWAKSLEEEGLVTIDYSFGKMYVINKPKDKNVTKEVTNKLLDNVERTSREISYNLKEKEKMVKKEVELLKRLENILEEDLKKEQNLEKLIDKAREKEKEILEIFNNIKKEEKELVGEMAEIHSAIEDRKRRLEAIMVALEDYKKIKEDLEKQLKVILALNKDLKKGIIMKNKIKDIENKLLELRKKNNELNKKFLILKEVFSKL